MDNSSGDLGTPHPLPENPASAHNHPPNCPACNQPHTLPDSSGSFVAAQQHADATNSQAPGSSAASVSNASSEPEVYGWPALAQLMAKSPPYAAFPRFSDLNTRNLLYYQAELSDLRAQIRAKETEKTLNCERYDLLVHHAVTNPQALQYSSLMMKLRGLLREYNEALLQQSRLSAMPTPEAYDMRALQEWIFLNNDMSVRDTAGQVKIWGDLHYPEESFWRQLKTLLKEMLLARPSPVLDLDLVATHPTRKIGGFAAWFVYYLVPFIQRITMHYRIRNPQPELPVTEPRPQVVYTLEGITDSRIMRVSKQLYTILICLFPVLAIVVLTQLSGTRDLLLCISGFSLLFAIFLSRGTSSRTETLAATAAFYAVMVVFISQPVIQMAPGSEPPTIAK